MSALVVAVMHVASPKPARRPRAESRIPYTQQLNRPLLPYVETGCDRALDLSEWRRWRTIGERCS